MPFRLHASSVTGHGHLDAGLPNQDAVATHQSSKGWLVVVSDGMGSRPLSHFGSRAVCNAARSMIGEKSFDDTDEALTQYLEQAWRACLARWRVLPDQAVATCLLAWGMADGRFRLLQLGDGLIIGQPKPLTGLVTRDPAGFGNETTGLGLAVGLADWHCERGHLQAPGDGLVLMTDGISDDLEHTDGFVSATIGDLRRRSIRSAKATLTRGLRAWPVPGHTDDKSIALVYRHDYGHSNDN